MTKRTIFIIILLILSVLLAGVNIIWVSQGNRIPVLNNLVYLMMSQEYFGNLISGDLFSFLINRGNFHPPLPFQITSLFFLVLKPGYFAAYISQVFFVVILLMGTFLLGEHLWNEDVGFAAAILAAGFPQSAFFLKNISADMPMTAIVPLCLYALFKSDEFKNSYWTKIFFVIFAAGMLLRWNFIIYIGLPFLFVAGKALWENIREEAHRKQTLLFIAGAFVFLLLFWGGLNYFHGSPKLRSNPDAVEGLYFISLLLFICLYEATAHAVKIKIEQIKNLAGGILIFLCLTAHFTVVHLIPMKDIYKVWYWDVQFQRLIEFRTPWHFFVEFLLFSNFGIIFACFLLTGIFLYYFNKENRTLERNLMIPSMGFSILILFIQPVYESRYFLPLNPIASLIAVYWIFQLSRLPLKAAFLTVLGVLFLFYSFGWAVFPDFKPAGAFLGIITPPPDKSVERMDEFAEYFLNTYRKKPAPTSLLIGIKDDGTDDRMTPLLLLYYFRNHIIKKEQAAMLYRGADPIFPCREEPFGFLLFEKEDELEEESTDSGFYLKDKDMNEEGRERKPDEISKKNRLEGMKIHKVSADYIYICRIRNAQDRERFPYDILVQDEGSLSRQSFKEKPAFSLEVLEDTIIDVYEPAAQEESNQETSMLKLDMFKDLFLNSSFLAAALKAK